MQLSGKLPLLSEIALLIGFGWLVSGWLMPEQQHTPLPAPNLASGAAASLPALAQLLSTPLFGKAATPDQTAKPGKAAPKPVVVAPLTIKLLGTVVANDDSAAVIAKSAGAEEKLYFIGDSIMPGVTLKSVEANAIVVERNGRPERISMEKSVIPGFRPAAIAPAPAPRVSGPGFPAAPAARRQLMNRSQLDSQLQNFPRLLSQARVIPHMINGKADGFTISEIAPNSLYQQAGLQNGDIIINVNGRTISSAGEAMAIYQQLKNAPAIDLLIKRAGMPQRIHYDIH